MFLHAVRVRSLFAVGVIVLFLLLGAALTSVFSGEVDQRAYDGSNLVRLRFVANSDAPEDQAVKRKVRDYVLEGSRAWMSRAATGEEMRELIEAHQGSVLEDARRAVEELGRDDSVRVTWGMVPYEADARDPVRLPSGRYPTLQVIIGEGAGHNWWCLLFPTLCFGSERGIEPILPSAGGTSADVPAGDRGVAAAADEAPARSGAVRRPAESDRSGTNSSIRWALAGFSDPVFSAPLSEAEGRVAVGEDGAPGAVDASGFAAGGGGDTAGGREHEEARGQGARRFELRADTHVGGASLDRVRFRLGLFR